MKLMFILLHILYLSVLPTFSSRILGVVLSPYYSHQITFHPLWKQLSLRGHQLTVLTTDPLNDASLTNLTEIDLHKSYLISDKVDRYQVTQLNFYQLYKIILTLSITTLQEQLSHPDVQNLIKNKTQHFDLLIVEGLWPAATAFSARFQCPYIYISSLDVPDFVYSALGNPTHPVVNPDNLLTFSGQLTFLERLTSTLFSLLLSYYYAHGVSTHDLIVKKYFGEEYPYLQDIANNLSMLFVNTDPILHPIRALLPTVVQIGGGTHLRPPQPLPNFLQEYLNNASNGFIYFSLGTNARSEFLSNNTRNILLETFSDLPYKVLWKFELEDLPGKPENVLISKWFPQQDLLRHPNLKLFITQGGLQSIEEAVYNHVPIIGMPVIGDQASNVNRMVVKGCGLLVDYKTMDKVSLRKNILEVITNPKYRKKVRRLAQLARDQPTTGLERAVWWTEYVLRHKGAKHLKSPAVDLPLYQYYLLDVMGFCLAVLLVVIYVLVKLVVKLRSLCNFNLKAKVD